ncbi:PTS fructose transporter subunit IIABC [Corynebacterium ulceribovis]|uniref:PTS fructose transporter subunit IIABC n=1 Tax=Corynebacterium ulceribovis TaxID=487732 RepID=UPI00037B9F94|nr:fructose-specific PTS transporter subunit EIIC [Corynebacterium ulceribovis]
MSTPIITPQLVGLDVDLGTAPTDVITALAQQVADAGRATDAAQLAADALAREEKSATGAPGGVAIPHCRSAAVTAPTLAFARLSEKVDFGAPDGPGDLVFMIAAPEGAGKAHLKILSKLARGLVKPAFRDTLRAAKTSDELVEIVDKQIGPELAAATDTATPETADAKAEADVDVTRIVAITSCPTGVAHTYMAADSLTQAAEGRDDVTLQVEPQGSSAVTPLAKAAIRDADAVIFATDVGVKDRERFAGKPVIESGVKRAINEPNKMIDEAIAAAKNPNAKRVHAAGGGADGSGDDEEGASLSWGKRIQQAIMTGVSYMVPFVAASGLLLALGFLFGGYKVANVANDVVQNFTLQNLPGNTITLADGTVQTVDSSGLMLYIGSIFFATGGYGMGVIVAILSAFIAYGLAGRPGIAPGFIGGAISVAIGAGFLGGLVTGLVAGLIALGLQSFQVPRWLRSLMPVVIIPLLGSLGVGLLMFILLGRPLTALMEAMNNWLGSMSGASAAVLGIIIGLMMCSDMGGPINKAAYLFGTAGLSTGDEASLKVMAAVMAAGMVPPLAMALASVVRPQLFTQSERENGKAGWLLGASFISEGAIPFAAADPLRVIPSMMLGGATTGALSMALGAGSHAPHGGIFVLFAIDNPVAWIVAIVAGMVVGAAAVIMLKQFWKRSVPTGADAAANSAATSAPVPASN